jgi:replicative DNA helicase
MNTQFLHDDEIECAVLGAFLLEPKTCVLYLDDLTSGAFYSLPNQKIFEAIVQLHNEGNAVDILTVTRKLRENKLLEEVGGGVYIARLTNRVASTANVAVWCAMLKQLSMKRDFVRIGANVAQTSSQEDHDAVDVYTQFMDEMNAVFQTNLKVGAKRIEEIVKEATESIVARFNMIVPMSGYSTSIRAVDRILGGHQRSDLTYMAGRPAMGKTAMALSEVIALAKNNIPVAFFSLEMSSVQLVYRLASMESGIAAEQLMKYKLDKEQLTQYYMTVDALNTMPIYIDDSSSLSVFDFRAKLKQLVYKYKVEIAYIDYIQLMNFGGGGKRNNLNREQELSSISRTLKQIAKECNIPIVVLSQLSRQVESRQDKRPMLSDLRESGSLEQDADVVVFLYRPEYYGINETEDGSSTEGLAEYIVAKQRNGGTGIIPIKFNHERMQYTEWDEQKNKVNSPF